VSEPLLAQLDRAGVVLAISPHLDDAALSVGGAIAYLSERGAQVTVHTVFAGAPTGELSDLARDIHRSYGLAPQASAFAARYREDREGLGRLGARTDHGAFLESIYRRHHDGSWRVGDPGDIMAPAPEDAELIPAAAAGIVSLAQELGADLLLGPAATGGNVDHLITAEACRRAADRLGIAGLAWEDQPYGWNLLPGTEPFSPLLLSPALTARKVDALSLYLSQTRMLWPGADWRAVVEAHALERFGPLPSTAAGGGPSCPPPS
jgi:LmbE family N-acetylglucosaminyl deacetylase